LEAKARNAVSCFFVACFAFDKKAKMVYSFLLYLSNLIYIGGFISGIFSESKPASIELMGSRR
jgi:hypothetical protein